MRVFSTVMSWSNKSKSYMTADVNLYDNFCVSLHGSFPIKLSCPAIPVCFFSPNLETHPALFHKETGNDCIHLRHYCMISENSTKVTQL